VNKGTVAIGWLDGGTWSASFGQSIVRLFLADAFGPRRILPRGAQLRNYCGSGGIPQGRNQIAASFLDDTACEWLFVVDSDMGFEPSVVEDLIAAADYHERPIVGALCFGLKREGCDGATFADKFRIAPTLYSWVARDDDAGFLIVPDYPRGELVKVAGTGSAAVLIHRRAMRKIREKYGPIWYDPVRHPNGRVFGEDLSFCIRAAGCDLPIYVHTGVKTSHDKGGVFLDEEAFDRQQALDAPPAPEPVTEKESVDHG
jgi:hypothetical protein